MSVKIDIKMIAKRLLQQCLRQPRLGGQTLGFKRLDLVAVAQGQADVVKAIDQAVFAEGLHLKRQFLAVGFDDDLALQVDRQAVAGKGGALRQTAGRLALRSSTMGSRPFLKLLLKKMSA